MHFTMRRSSWAAVLALLAVSIPASAGAQVRASERGSVSQTVDGTVITIDYSRPRTRGRVIFGKTVHWGEVWTPGANWATTLDVSRDVKLDSHLVPKGKYSVWFVVQPTEWTVVLDRDVKRYHTEPPDSTAGQLRWKIRPQSAPHTEMLTWSFPEIRPDGATLVMQWGTARASIDASVFPTHPLTIARSAIEPYLGKYLISLDMGGSDSVFKGGETVELYYEAGSLMARYEPSPEWYPRIQRSIMVRINDDWFMPVIFRDGKVWEMVSDMIFEFTVADGRATNFELRDDKDGVLGRGKRVPEKSTGRSPQ